MKDELKLLPKIVVKHKVEVTDEDKIVEGDIVSVKVDLFRMHLLSPEEKKGLVGGDVDVPFKEKVKKLLGRKTEGYVHCPLSPLVIKGGFHIMLSD